jgi:pyridinium-3,5-bisthiocarboxylic acid mononucleotide nickel chelatase
VRTIHLDALGGIAGDMFVAAMLDAFPDLRDRVFADAVAVLPAEAGAPNVEEGRSGAVRALRFGLADMEAKPREDHLVAAGQGHTDEGDHHDHGQHRRDIMHDHDKTPRMARHVEHDGRFRALVARIEAARLSPGTAEHAVSILTILAEAEARIHNVNLDEVHFHEIADWDSLLDVVAAGSIAAALEPATWTISPLPRGGGPVHTQHGLLPVPAPATAAILAGFEWRDDGIFGERVTPTGAAILRHLAAKAGGVGQVGRLVGSGTGAGTRSLPGMPNILRALVFDSSDPLSGDRVTVISFEIDDMTGEEIGVAADRLRAVPGVLDLSIGQRWGKKGRPMQSFRLLVRPDMAQRVAERCLAETSTIGLRLSEERRIVLGRDASIPGGIGVKSVGRPGGRTAKAESDDLAGDSLAARRRMKRQAEDGDG